MAGMVMCRRYDHAFANATDFLVAEDDVRDSCDEVEEQGSILRAVGDVHIAFEVNRGVVEDGYLVFVVAAAWDGSTDPDPCLERVLCYTELFDAAHLDAAVVHGEDFNAVPNRATQVARTISESLAGSP